MDSKPDPDEVDPSAERPALNLTHRRQRKRSEIIAAQLTNYIVDSGLPAGSMLPREKDMIEQLGVGRTTLREALRLLEVRGLLTIRSGPQGGPVVRTPQPADLTEALSLILQFNRATLRELLEARIWLEPISARMAVPRITQAEIARLKQANADMRASTPQSEAIVEANERFHRIIAGATANLIVQIFSETLQLVAETGAGDLRHSEELRELAIKGHDEIIAAFEAGDADRVEAAMRDHLSEGRDLRVSENQELTNRPLRWLE